MGGLWLLMLKMWDSLEGWNGFEMSESLAERSWRSIGRAGQLKRTDEKCAAQYP